MSKSTGNNRINILKRLSKPSPLNNNANRGQFISSTNSSVQDARELLTSRNKASFDARQLLSRQSSKTLTKTIVRSNLSTNNDDIDDASGNMVVVTGLKDMKMKDGRLIFATTAGSSQVEKKKAIFAVGPSTFVTIRNNSNNNDNVSSIQSTEKISFTKTIKNPSVCLNDDSQPSQSANSLLSLQDRKVAISFVNDKYQKNVPAASTTTVNSSSSIQQHHPPPIVKRLHDASIQTTPSSSSSRSPIRMSSHRRHTNTTIDDEDRLIHQTIDDDFYEPPIKRTSSTRKTTTATAINKEYQDSSSSVSTSSVKRTSTGAPISSRITSNTSTVPKPTTTAQNNSTPGTILVTNLQTTVTEDDVIELFGEIGRINEITTLSQGCVQIIYAKREHGEQAVAKYHNRLLDGQFMYVSLQQPLSYSTTHHSKINNNNNNQQQQQQKQQQPIKENEITSNSTSTTVQPLKLNATSNTSKKIVIDPTFIRQALFHPSNNSTNPVQFQVKL